jgi:hypothetical protein
VSATSCARRRLIRDVAIINVMESYCDECGEAAQGFVLTGGRKLCGVCYKRFFPDECRKIDEQNEILRKRAEKMKWLRLVDLPGYKEWSDQFQGLDRIISNLNEHHLLVHPDEFYQSPEAFFVQVFQGWLDDYADRGARHRSLDEYRKPDRE